MGMSSSLKKKLAAASKKFKGAKAPSSTGMVNDSVLDGNYEATLVGAELTEQASKAALIYTYKINEDDAEAGGEEIKQRFWLETEQNLSFLKRDLGRFGYEVDDLDLAEELEGLCKELVDAEPLCRISVKTDGEWQNVYLNKVLEMQEENDEEEEEDDEEEEEKKPAKGKKSSDDKKPSKSSKASKQVVEEEEEEEEEEEKDDDEEEAEAPEIEKGSIVMFTPPRAKKAVECIVTSIDKKKASADLRGPNKEKFSGIKLDVLELVEEEEEPEAEAEEAEEETAELDVGSKVFVTVKGVEQKGVVKEVDEESEQVKVFVHKLRKTVTVSVDQIEIDEK